MPSICQHLFEQHAEPDHMIDFIASMPKAELHMHLEGAIEPELLLELAARNRVSIPFESPDAVRAAYSFTNLQSFLDLYYLGLTVLRTEQDFFDVTWSYLQRMAVEAVRHAEVFISPQAHLGRGIAFATMMEPILEAFVRAKDAFGLSGGCIIGIQRHRTEEEALAMIDAALPWRDSIIGLGLGGAEIGNRPGKFARAFECARQLGWKTMAHAGEEGGPDYVTEALDLLKVDRIDHGVRASEDEALMRRLAREGTPLTVCPLSNVCLRIYPDLTAHSLRRLFEAGVKVTINSDDPPYFGGYLTQNFLETRDALGLDDRTIYAIARNGFLAAFIDEETRGRYLGELAAHEATHRVGVIPP